MHLSPPDRKKRKTKTTLFGGGVRKSHHGPAVVEVAPFLKTMHADRDSAHGGLFTSSSSCIIQHYKKSVQIRSKRLKNVSCSSAAMTNAKIL